MPPRNFGRRAAALGLSCLIVGTILTLINQGDRLFSGQSLNFTKLALTYLLRYFVITYGTVSFRLYAEGGDATDSS